MSKYILSFDQGTTSSRAILFDHQGQMRATAQKEFQQIFPKPGWVEHDPLEIWSTQMGVATEVISMKGLSMNEVAAIGITTQRDAIVYLRATICQILKIQSIIGVSYPSP